MTKEEFEELVNDYEKDIYTLCLRLCSSKEEAEDLLQDVFLDVLKNMANINKEKNPKSYLLGRTIYLRKSQKRKWARRNNIIKLVPISDEESDNKADSNSCSPLEIVIKKDMINKLKNEIVMLKDKYRIVIELYYTLGLKSEEISEILHVPKGTVENRLFRARKILKTKLEDDGYGT